MYHIFLSACCFRFVIHFCWRQFLFNVHGTCVVNLFMPIWCFMIIYSTYFPLASHRWCVFLFYVSSSFLCHSVCLVISYIVYIFLFDAVRLKAYWIFLPFLELPTLTKRQLTEGTTPLHHDNWKSHVELFSENENFDQLEVLWIFNSLVRCVRVQVWKMISIILFHEKWLNAKLMKGEIGV